LLGETTVRSSKRAGGRVALPRALVVLAISRSNRRDSTSRPSTTSRRLRFGGRRSDFRHTLVINPLLLSLLGPLNDFLLLDAVLGQNWYKVLGHRSGKLEALREFHQLVEFDGAIVRGLVATALLHLELLAVGKLAEMIQHLCLHIRSGIIGRRSLGCGRRRRESLS
jgi:hypothetical protein